MNAGKDFDPLFQYKDGISRIASGTGIGQLWHVHWLGFHDRTLRMDNSAEA